MGQTPERKDEAGDEERGSPEPGTVNVRTSPEPVKSPGVGTRRILFARRRLLVMQAAASLSSSSRLQPQLHPQLQLPRSTFSSLQPSTTMVSPTPNSLQDHEISPSPSKQPPTPSPPAASPLLTPHDPNPFNAFNTTTTQTRSYTHTQPPQTFIPPPITSADPISLTDNPDAIALRAAISLLQIQKQTAEQDLRTLSDLRKRALADPAAFTDALASGTISSRPDAFFDLPRSSPPAPFLAAHGTADATNTAESRPDNATISELIWPTIPTAQNIVKMPHINWAQYAVVGESLDKLHDDQLTNPTPGAPAQFGTDGRVVFSSGSKATAVGTPGARGVDKKGGSSLPGFEKMSTRKGGKR